MDDRLNSPSTSAVMLEVLGHQLHLSQDPNSKHLGTTVWDASMVFVKFMERNSRKGRFCPSKMKGKRVIELGAGCGLAGIGMAMLGCDVVSTDQVEVLPLLMRNVERNTSYIIQAGSDFGSFGSIQVAELDWGNKDHIRALNPPFDYIIGTDVVYSEHLLQPLLETILALSGPRTIIMLGYEIRSTVVHEQMLRMWNSYFEVKNVPKLKMDVKYRHPSIQLYIMEQKTKPLAKEVENQAAESNVSKEENKSCRSEERQELECQAAEFNLGNEEGKSCSTEESQDVENGTLAPEETSELKNATDEWGIRRCGAMAARLLRDVKM